MDEYKELRRDTFEKIDKALREANLPDKVRVKYYKTAEEVFGNLTLQALQKVHAHIREYRFYRTHKALMAALQAKYPSLQPKGEIKGCFDRDGTLHLNGGGTLAGRKAALHEFYAHELTHALDGNNHEISGSEAWRQAWAAEKNYFVIGKKTPTEGLAEFGQMLLGGGISREEMAEVMPRCLNVWEVNGL